jgi:hypothetical protein
MNRDGPLYASQLLAVPTRNTARPVDTSHFALDTVFSEFSLTVRSYSWLCES